MLQKPKILVVGGNAAGPSAAAKAKRTNPDAEVILFESGSYISTGTCELPYLLSDKIDDYKKIVFFTPEEFYEEKKVAVYINHVVESINRGSKTVSVKNKSDGSIYNYEYDKLILTTGAVPKRLPNEPSEVSNLFNLKSVADYRKIDQYLKSNRVKNVIVIGGGYIGIEVAENLKQMNYSVKLLEKNSVPMPSAEEEISHLIKNVLDENDIDFISNLSNLKFNTRNNKVTSLNVDGRIIEGDLVISAIGFKPNSQLALAAGLKVGAFGGISVNKKLQTDDLDIFAAGDCIEVTNAVTNQDEYIPLATLAHEQGHLAGANAAGNNDFYAPVVKNTAVKVFDNVYTSVGINSAGARQNNIMHKTVSALAPNLVKVMPESKKTFGKIIYEKENKRILGAEFFGYQEVIGYADLISALIFKNESVDILDRIHFNYTPPNSPFINILSILGRKAIKQ